MTPLCGIIEARANGATNAFRPLTHPLDSTEKGAADNEPGLFDMEPVIVAPSPMDGMSTGQRLTHRQKVAIANGHHPLSVALHTSILLRSPVTSDHRCGTCTHRDPGQYPKCLYGAPSRMSHGAGTDCRAWWPACRDYEPVAAALAGTPPQTEDGE